MDHGYHGAAAQVRHGLPGYDGALYRAHYVSRSWEEALLAAKIPYTIYSGVQFFGRMEIKDALSYLRMIVYRDDLSFRRLPTCPSGTWASGAWPFWRTTRRTTSCTLYQPLTETVEEPALQGHQARQFCR